jgi:hypothetical protein
VVKGKRKTQPRCSPRKRATSRGWWSSVSPSLQSPSALPSVRSPSTQGAFSARSPPREEDEGEQDVWYFVSTGDLDKVAALLASGQFTIDQPDNDGRTPLMWAVDKGD